MKLLVLADGLKVYPVAFANDETAIKPFIQFEKRGKVKILDSNRK